MQAANKSKVEKIILMIFLALLVLDASKIFFPAPVAPVEQQQQEQNSEQDQNNINSDENIQNSFDEDEADSNFQEFKENEFDEEKEQEKRRKKQQRSGNQKKSGSYSDPNTVFIQYCSQSPYKQEAKWQELQKSLESEITFITVQGSEYPAPQIKQILGKICSYLQYFMLAFSLFGDKIFGFLSMPYPKWYLLFKEKKMVFIGIGFLAGSFGANYFLQTNAFEIVLNDQFIYSNLTINGQPDISQVIQIISESIYLK